MNAFDLADRKQERKYLPTIVTEYTKVAQRPECHSKDLCENFLTFVALW
jgi:hypothetical protein